MSGLNDQLKQLSRINIELKQRVQQQNQNEKEILKKQEKIEEKLQETAQEINKTKQQSKMNFIRSRLYVGIEFGRSG